jgi:hypothetical protein
MGKPLQQRESQLFASSKLPQQRFCFSAKKSEQNRRRGGIQKSKDLNTQIKF